MLLYVMSRPHSGSTILDILLGQGASTASVGQLVSDMGKPHNPCACGDTVGSCAFWSEVREGVEARGVAWEDAVRLSVGQAHVKNFWRTLRAEPSDPWLRELASATEAIEASLVEASGARVVCDSSKEPTRALFLLKAYPKAKLIHLVRDPRGSVASHYWRLKEKGFYHFLRKDRRPPKALRPLVLPVPALAWLAGNALFELAIRHDPSRVLRLRYEDLRDDPSAALARIGAFLGVDLSDAAAKVAAGGLLDPGHLIGGNDVRLEKGLRFEPGREGTRRRPPAWVDRLTLALCYPLARRYGYAGAKRPAALAGAPAPKPGRA